MHEAAHSSFSVLSALIALPAVGAAVIALVSRRRPEVSRILALIFSLTTGAIAVWVLANFETHTGGFQFTESHTWIESLGISWSVGMDGISLFLVVLTGVLFPIAFVGSDPHHDDKPYYAWLLLLEAGCLGVFLSLDLFQFFLMFEVVLVPMYFLIGGWGYAERVYAANKFFLFTMLGSAFMLVSLLALAFLHQQGVGGDLTFDLQTIAENPGIATETARWLFLGFAAAFAVKVPLFPLHTWLPDAHTQAPTAGSVILAGVMLKLGTYGFLRFGLFLFPEAARYWAPLFLTLGVIGIIYGAVVATMQKDLKRLVAYSSVAHLGFIALGTFAMTNQSLQGAVLQAVNHGISTPALFLLVGMIYERRHTRQISALKGLQKSAPILAAVFTVVMLSSIGVPGLNGFTGEFLILLGSFLTARWWTVVAAAGVILAALYLLWAYQRVFHGEPDEENAEMRDLKLSEGLVLAPLLGLIVFLGVYPKPLIERIEPSVDALIAHIETQTGEEIQPEVAEEGFEIVADDLPEPQHAEDAEAEGDELMLAQEVVRLETPDIDWSALAPILILIGGATLLLVVDALSLRRPKAGIYSLYTVIVAGASIAASVPLWQEVHDPERGPFTVVAGALGIDGFSVFFFVVIASAVLLAALVADGYLRREKLDGPEFYVLVMLSASGGMVMAAANDLMVTFLGLEILSIAVYILAALHLRRNESQEAAIKYFVLGAFSSAFFLYGIALVYGATGTTRLPQIAAVAPALSDGAFGDSVSTVQIAGPPALLLAGIALLIVGFGFKVAAVPFHSWTPDVYQGSPTPAVVYMASGVKAAGFAGMLRVLVATFGGYAVDWQPYIYALAVATLLVGAILAIVQTDVKRMLAYSSISHAGFILVGVHAASARGVSGALFYLAAYTFMVAGSFGVIAVVSRTGDDATTLDDFRGLARRRPVLAFAMAVFLLAQLGAPFTSGFVAKFEVLAAAAEGEHWWLALVAMIAAVIGAYLYLRIIVAMYMAEDEEAANARAGADHGKVPFGATLALGLAAGVTVLVGFLPGLLDDLTDDAVPEISAPAED